MSSFRDCMKVTSHARIGTGTLVKRTACEGTKKNNPKRQAIILLNHCSIASDYNITNFSWTRNTMEIVEFMITKFMVAK